MSEPIVSKQEGTQATPVVVLDPGMLHVPWHPRPAKHVSASPTFSATTLRCDAAPVRRDSHLCEAYARFSVGKS